MEISGRNARRSGHVEEDAGGARLSKVAGSNEVAGDNGAGAVSRTEARRFGIAAGVAAKTSGRWTRHARQSWGAESARREPGTSRDAVFEAALHSEGSGWRPKADADDRHAARSTARRTPRERRASSIRPNILTGNGLPGLAIPAA